MAEKIYLCCDYSYNRLKCILYFRDEPVLLSKNETKLFNLLFQKRGHIVLSETIEENIWPDYPIKDSTRRTLVYRLRKKLNSNLVEHIPRVGCRLVVDEAIDV